MANDMELEITLHVYRVIADDDLAVVVLAQLAAGELLAVGRRSFHRRHQESGDEQRQAGKPNDGGGKEGLHG